MERAPHLVQSTDPVVENGLLRRDYAAGVTREYQAKKAAQGDTNRRRESL